MSHTPPDVEGPHDPVRYGRRNQWSGSQMVVIMLAFFIASAVLLTGWVLFVGP